MSQDIFCVLTKTDGTARTMSLPDKQVKLMTDQDSEAGALLCEILGVASVEIVNSGILAKAESINSTKSPR